MLAGKNQVQTQNYQIEKTFMIHLIMRVCLIIFSLCVERNRNSTNIFLNIINVNSWNLSSVSHRLYSFHELTQYVYWRNFREFADSHQNTQLGRGRVRIHTKPGCKPELSTPEGHLGSMKGTQVFTSLCWRQAEAFRSPFNWPEFFFGRMAFVPIVFCFTCHLSVWLSLTIQWFYPLKCKQALSC